MSTRLSPTHRYVILRGGVPVYTTNDCQMLTHYLWGRDIKDNYVVYDYETPYPVDTPDLWTWLTQLEVKAAPHATSR